MANSYSRSAADKERATSSSLGQIYDLITGDEDARVCKDIPEAACRYQPRNFFAYLVSNVFTKVADELTSARLILPWLLGVLGAPAAFTGFLVPIREAGVLLPQLLVAAYIRRLPRRGGAWFLGTGLCAVAVLLMLLPVTQLSGAAAGWAVLGLVTLFSLAKGICSVSAKDVLGKTVSKTRRGTLMGYSAGVAGTVTLAIGIYVEWYAAAGRDGGVFVGFLLAAGLLYLASIAVFAFIVEEAGATEGGGNAIRVALESLSVLRSDPAFRRFVIARSLLLSVALVLPFYALLAQRHSDQVTGLGLLIIAGGLATSLSSPLWGRLGDRSSRLVMAVAAAAAGVTGIATGVLAAAGAACMDSVWSWAVVFFLIAAFHNGVRLGRKTYLVDLSTQQTRATYVAVSNTVIGAAMFVGGAFGVIADILSPAVVIGTLGLLALVSAAYILRLPEVSG